MGAPNPLGCYKSSCDDGANTCDVIIGVAMLGVVVRGGGDCDGDCEGDCEGDCGGDSGGDCDGDCDGDCAGDCDGDCGGDCGGEGWW